VPVILLEYCIVILCFILYLTSLYKGA